MEFAKNQNLEPITEELRREFIERCRKNPAYSLRAFARFLEIDQSFLSKLLNGHRALTPEMAQAFVLKLDLPSTKLKSLFTQESRRIPDFLTLSDDEFEMISEWYHFAILELAKTKAFNSDPVSIAQRLGLHVQEVRDALQRLQRLGFINLDKKGIQLLKPNMSWSQSKKTSEGRKKLQRALLEKSLHAIDNVPFELREAGSLTVAVNKSRILEFKTKIQQMRKELADFFQADGEQGLDEVYQLTVSFFPLTKAATTTKKK